ncbi:hypothetical protein [Aquimarina algiphila]|uniref:hypothetical protein n=1 Tax=Aquimarina algiphila TaxID=2047982 RepID=UPI00232C69B5|nr:hypothetical protein [Aquimarina algiphila]
MEENKYTITDIKPKKGDWAVSTEYTKPVPRLVSSIIVGDEEILGFDLSKTDSWFKWLPLRDHHKKVIIHNVQS